MTESNDSGSKEILANEVKIGPPRLTIYELARIIGARAIQIAYGAPILIPIPREVTNEPIEITIAKEELKAKVLPITIQRWLPDGRYQNIPVVWLKYDPYI